MVRWLELLPSSLFALLLGILLMMGVIALSRDIALQIREPSEYLPHALVEVIVWEKEEGRGLASYLPGIPLPLLPEELRSSVAPERVIALLSGSGMLTPIVFHRLLSSQEASDRARAYVEKESAQVSIVGPYLVLGLDALPSGLLKPNSPERLQRDPRFRSAAEHIPAHASAIYVQRRAHSLFPLSLPPLLRAAVTEEPWMLLTLRQAQSGRTGETTLSIILPSTVSPLSRSSPLLSLVSNSASLFFGVSGSDAGSELQKLLSLLSGGDADRSIVLEGFLHAAYAHLFGEEMELRSLFPVLRDTPYAFLLSEARLPDGQGSPGTLAWLFAAEQRKGSELMEEVQRLERGFSSRFPLAMVRERTLPSGKVVRDVVSDPRALTREEDSYRGYRLVQVRHIAAGQELIRGTPLRSASQASQSFAGQGRGDVVLLSSEMTLLRHAIDTLADASLWGPPDGLPHGTTHTVFVTQDALRFSAPLIGDAPFFQSLPSFLPEGKSMRWYRVSQGSIVRHTFLLP